MKNATIGIKLLLLFLVTWNARGNVAQPGVWQAGGAASYSLLFPDDSIVLSKVLMIKEAVFIQLYPGYAVVKGVYDMYNESDADLVLKAGYPVNSIYNAEQGSYLTEIEFDSLYQLKVLINQEEVSVQKEEPAQQLLNSYIENWYVWTNEFPSKDTTQITIYFIVNTNHSYVRRGYKKSHANGFIYLLESGSTWKQPLGKGDIYLQIMPGLLPKSIHGLLPDSVWNVCETHNLLKYSFENLFVSQNDNIVLVYGREVKEFDFSEIVKMAGNLYQEVDSLQTITKSNLDYTPVYFPDPHKFTKNSSPGVFTILTTGGIAVFFGLFVLLVLLIIFLTKKGRNKE